MQPKIDPEFKALLAPLTKEEYAGLEESILERGCLDTIKTWNDYIIDGHNRFSICMRHGLLFDTEPLDFDTREDVIEWMIRNQLARRNQTKEQIDYFQGMLYRKMEKRQGQRTDLTSAQNAQKLSTAQLIANDYGVDQSTIRRNANYFDAVEIFGDEQGIEAKEQLLAGKLPVTKKDVVQLAQMTEEKRKAITEKIATGATMADAIREDKRAEVIAKLEDIDTKTAKELAGQYDVIVIDPPWPMEKIERDVRPNQSEFDYPTMSEEELADMILPAADACHLWLWTTHKFLPMAFRLLDAWEFKYVCTFVWHKPGGFQPIGLPQYNCEFALYARRGAPSFIDTKALPVCFEAPRGKHSEKPEAFYDVVRRVTAGRRIDIFNRRAIEGFESWGKEAAE